MTLTTKSLIKLDEPCKPPLQSSNQQLGFMAALHPDVILTIFSFLTRQDCLTCMAVCQDWYKTVPQYSQRFWTELRLTGHHLHNENQRQICCLGDHVKTVTLEAFDHEQELYHTMHKLLDWGCTKLKSLELKQCHTEDHDAFLDALTKLAPQLTHLKMLGHGSNVAFLHVFDACPELTHFTYHIDAEVWDTSNVYDTEPVIYGSKRLLPSDRATKITHLYLDVIMDNQIRLYPILRRCPNLRCFVGPSKEATVGADLLLNVLHEYIQIQVDLDQLSDLCPMITSIQGYYTYFDLDSLEDMDVYITDSGSNGLRYLDICEDYGGNRIKLCVARNQDIMEYLSLRSYDDFKDDSNERFEWSPVFRSLELPRLHTLICDRIQFDSNSLVALLNNSPALEQFILNPARMRIDPPSIQSLGTLHQLRSLIFTSVQMVGPCFVMILDRVPALEELIVDICSVSIKSPIHHFNGLTRLKHLSLTYITWIDDERVFDMDHAVAHFIRCLTMQSKLETILLTKIPDFGAQALLTVADISSLKICDVDLGQIHCFKEALCAFATELLKTAIEILRIRSHASLASGVFEVLGNLPFLKELYLSPFYNFGSACEIDGLDFLQFLHKSKSLQGIYLYNVAVTRPGQTFHDQELSVLVEQEAPQYYLLKDSNQPPPPLKKARSPLKYDVAIKRKA